MGNHKVMGSMTRQLHRALTLAAVCAIAATAHANGGGDKKKKYSGHTIQDFPLNHTIQDGMGDSLGGRGRVTWDGGGSIGGEKIKAILDGADDVALDAGDLFIVEPDLSGGLELLRSTPVLDPHDLDLIAPDEDRAGGRIVLTAQGVPAPGALPLLGLGVATLIGRRRRRRG